MKENEKIFLGVVAALMLFVWAVVGFKVLKAKQPSPPPPPVETVEQQPVEEEEKEPQVYVNVFFIGQNEHREEVYKAVKRAYDKKTDGSKIKFAITALIAGPKDNEKSKGVYTEIPAATKVIAVSEMADKVAIDLTSSFETGGGTDSLYKRIYQIIKTAKNNTDKPVYLYINGKKADVIGGEGIMLTQPLNNNSLDAKAEP